MSSPTFHRFTKSLHLIPGVQYTVFEMLKIKVEALSEIYNYCIIRFDEMSLKANLFYNLTRDKVIGFENKRGIFQLWKQPLAYFFQIRQLLASHLLDILYKVHLRNIGLKVVGVISDMGSNFIKLSELLHINIKKDPQKFKPFYLIIYITMKSN
ncbi:THAP domain-containing protein 9 [Cyphomyrmex costatus]|uniref:THAP domain-containing protein 9 n=1 Tax=Cyphomyrmex costatus TaxID=456900 RepID=A0A195CVQ5_9HYME|nr:THAP domain-containing protein 9 [Cyphomyrmex costatus]